MLNIYIEYSTNLHAVSLFYIKQVISRSICQRGFYHVCAPACQLPVLALLCMRVYFDNLLGVSCVLAMTVHVCLAQAHVLLSVIHPCDV